MSSARRINVVVNDGENYENYKNKQRSRKAAQQQPYYKNKTGEELVEALVLAQFVKDKHLLDNWKRQQTNEKKRKNILRNHARDANVKNVKPLIISEEDEEADGVN